MQIKSTCVISWSSRKKKRGQFLYRLFCLKGFFKDLCFISIYGVLNTLSNEIFYKSMPLSKLIHFNKINHLTHWCVFLISLWWNKNVWKCLYCLYQIYTVTFFKLMLLLGLVKWPLTPYICRRQKPTCLRFLVISATLSPDTLLK